jgi:hypothetical protein
MRHNAARLGSLVSVGLAVAIGTLILVGSRPLGLGGPLSIQPPSEAASDSRFARIGETVKLQGWEVTLLDFAPYQGASSGPSGTSGVRGSLFVADVRVTNIQSRASEYSLKDFAVRAGDGRRFGPSPDTWSIERALVTGETVQSLETSERRVLFDVPADARDLVLQVLEVEFGIPPISPS